MNLELTEFERKLFYMVQIRNRLGLISVNFEGLPQEPNQEDYCMKSVVREYAIIQLANFLDIKKSVESDSALKDKKHLKECLEPLASIIESKKKAIGILRDSFYAHVGDKPNKRFDDFMEEVIDNQFPKNPEEIVFLSRCVCGYIDFFHSNFQKEWNEMERKVEDYRPVLTGEPHRSYEEIEAELTGLATKVGTCLRTHGLLSKLNS